MRFAVLITLTVFAVSLGCGGGGLSTAPQSVSLAYKTAGHEYLQYKASTSITYNVGGTVRQSLHDITYSVRVDSIAADGTIDRRLKFDDFVMGELSGSRLELDPDAEKYKGEALYLKIGPNGELLKWQGLEGVRGYTVSDKNLKDDIVQMMTEFFQPLADEEVTVGSTFQRIVEIPVKRPGGEVNFKITIDYEVEGFGQRRERSCVKLKTKSLIEAEGEGERGGGKKYWVSLTGDGGGEFWFDYVNGIPVESSGKATITSDFSYERAGKEDVATQFATIDVESKTELLE
jgi:hypothetical protein